MTKISDLNQKITLMKDNKKSDFSASTLSRAKFEPIMTVRASISLIPKIEAREGFKITFKNMKFNNHISAVKWNDKILFIKKLKKSDEKYVSVVANE